MGNDRRLRERLMGPRSGEDMKTHRFAVTIRVEASSDTLTDIALEIQ